jgi:FkbM family methyltransferase
MIEYYPAIKQIFLSKGSVNKRRTLFNYLKIIVKAYIHHKIAKKLLYSSGSLKIKLFNQTIYFTNYSVLLYLFEDIFIKEVYRIDLQKEDPQIIDCGSNMGLPILYYKLIYPAASILAFEPDPQIFSLLQRNVDKNFKGVQCLQVALCNSIGTRNFYIYKDNLNSLNSSLYKSNRFEFATIKVNTEKLSSYISSLVDIIKIDTEGAEVEILEDLVESGKIKYAKSIIIEHHKESSVLRDILVERMIRANFKVSINEGLYLFKTD